MGVNLDGGLPLECDACGRIGKYGTAEEADQMRDVHIAVHSQDDPTCDPPGMTVLPWLTN